MPTDEEMIKIQELRKKYPAYEKVRDYDVLKLHSVRKIINKIKGEEYGDE